MKDRLSMVSRKRRSNGAFFAVNACGRIKVVEKIWG